MRYISNRLTSNLINSYYVFCSWVVSVSNSCLFMYCWLKGAELSADEGRSASALAACRTLAEELTEFRFPAPRILAFKVSFPL